MAKTKSASASATSKAPKVGDTVICDGERCQITEMVGRFSSTTGERVEALRYESARMKHYGLVRDLLYCPTLGAWYLWGRVMSADQIATVVELRDRGLLAARATRTPGSAPAAGEHHQIYLALFNDAQPQLWRSAMTEIRGGRGVPADAAKRIADLAKRFTKKLEHGYADRDADDSHDEG